MLVRTPSDRGFPVYLESRLAVVHQAPCHVQHFKYTSLSIHVKSSCPWHSPSVTRTLSCAVNDSGAVCTANVSWWAMLPDAHTPTAQLQIRISCGRDFLCIEKTRLILTFKIQWSLNLPQFILLIHVHSSTTDIAAQLLAVSPE